MGRRKLKMLKRLEYTLKKHVWNNALYQIVQVVQAPILPNRGIGTKSCTTRDRGIKLGTRAVEDHVMTGRTEYLNCWDVLILGCNTKATCYVCYM